MNVEYEIQKLRADLNNLQVAFLQAQRNNSNTVGKVDDTSNKVTQITPYTDTKTAYIGDTEVTFEGVPTGNLSVFGLSEYAIDRQNDRITITFDAVDEVTEISISIQ